MAREVLSQVPETKYVGLIYKVPIMFLGIFKVPFSKFLRNHHP